MKSNMRAIGPEFNTNRMVRQYTEEMYLPAFRRSEELEEKNYERTHKFVEWQQRVHKQWNNIRIDNISIDTAAGLKVGDNCIIRAKVFLGELKPEDVSVQAYYGVLDAGGEIYQPLAIAMKDGGKHEGQTYEFIGTIKLEFSGRIGHTVRVLPKHPDLGAPYREGLIYWAKI
jgi:starch phosphorylase